MVRIIVSIITAIYFLLTSTSCVKYDYAGKQGKVVDKKIEPTRIVEVLPQGGKRVIRSCEIKNVPKAYLDNQDFVVFAEICEESRDTIKFYILPDTYERIYIGDTLNLNSSFRTRDFNNIFLYNGHFNPCLTKDKQKQ